MNLDKAQKRITKKAKKGFQGYPVLTIAYYGPNDKLATQVAVGFIAEENTAAQFEKFNTETDIREDVTIQSTIVKIMDRCGAKTVSLTEIVIGCPHEEGVDYPQGEACPKCTYWHGKKPITVEFIQ